jgi:hypothetical protein
VNNCIGVGNYKYFLALLLSTSTMLFYGSYLAYSTLAPTVRWHLKEYPDWHELSYAGRTDMVGRMLLKMEGWVDALSTAFMVGGLSMGGVGLLATLTAPLPLGLLGYHIYLIWAGMTTNETGKWADWRDDMDDGLAFMADVKSEAVYGLQLEAQENGNATGNLSNKESEFIWPVRSRQVLVRTSDGQTPRNIQPQLQKLVVEDSWRRCWRLADVENVYDQGFWENLLEVLRH